MPMVNLETNILRRLRASLRRRINKAEKRIWEHQNLHIRNASELPDLGYLAHLSDEITESEKAIQRINNALEYERELEQ